MSDIKVSKIAPTQKDNSDTSRIVGADPSTGVPSNYSQVDSNGSLQVNLRDNSGNNIGTVTNPLFAALPTHIATDNSTTTPLGVSGVFTGAWHDVLGASIITVSIFSSHNSATRGFQFQTSTDATNWDDGDSYSIYAAAPGEAKVFSFGVTARYFRIVYTNGAVAQTTFRLQTLVHYMHTKPSSHRVGDPILDDDDAELTKTVIAGKSDAGDFKNVTVDNNGRLKVTSPITGRLDYDDMNAGTGGVARDTVITSTFTTIYSYSGAGSLLAFTARLEKADVETWDVKLLVDAAEVFTVTTDDIKEAYKLDDDTKAEVMGIAQNVESFRFKVPNNQSIPFSTSLTIQVRKTGATKKFKAGLVALIKG